MNTLCTHQLRSCDYKEDGCQFMGYTKELTKHYKDQAGYHTQLMKQTFKKVEQAMDNKIRTLKRQNSELNFEINRFKREISLQLQSVADAVVKAESAIQHLQEGFAEMALALSGNLASYHGATMEYTLGRSQRFVDVGMRPG